MSDPTGTRDHARALNDIVLCGHCGISMLKIGVNYTCTTHISNETNSCPTESINAQELLQFVVVRLIKQLINEQTAAQLVTAIRDEYGEKARRARESLHRTEKAIAEINELKGLTIQTVEHGDSTYSEVITRIGEINQQALGLSYEARLSRKEIEAYDFITDEARIKNNAQDPATYLEYASPEDTRDLLNLFVQSVQVDNDRIVINYTDQVPCPVQSDEKDQVQSD